MTCNVSESYQFHHPNWGDISWLPVADITAIDIQRR
jgi:hypothetical protein